MQSTRVDQKSIFLGTHGENYGNWMSNPVFYIVGIGAIVSAALAAIFFVVTRIFALGIVCSMITAALVILLCWITWIRRQYSFSGGGMMEQVHRVVLSHLDYQGEGTLLEVGCGSGAHYVLQHFLDSWVLLFCQKERSRLLTNLLLLGKEFIAQSGI